MITIKRTSIETLCSIAKEWNTFLETSTNNNIFLTYEWLSSWWNAFKTDSREFYFMLARDADDNIVGAFPLQMVILRFGRLLPLKFLVSIGRGALDHEETEYMTFMMPPTLPGIEKKVYAAMAAYLATHGDEWDLIALTNLLSGNASTPILENELNKIFKLKRSPQGNNYVINLSETYDAFLKRLSRNKRRNFKRRTKRLHKDYDVRLALITRENEIERYMKDYYLLVRQRHHWAPNRAKEAFMKTLCRNLARSGWLRSYMLFLNDVPSATIFGFAYNQKYYAYKAAFNPDFFAVSPGTALYAFAIQNEIEQGIKELDYLIGEYDYKQYWSNEVREIDYIRIYSGSIKSRLKVHSIQLLGKIFKLLRLFKIYLKKI